MAATIMAQIPSRNHPYTKIISPPPSPSARSFIFFSDDKGRVLHGEEKAAENIHIQKMEREKLEKAKQKAEKEREEKEGNSGAWPNQDVMYILCQSIEATPKEIEEIYEKMLQKYNKKYERKTEASTESVSKSVLNISLKIALDSFDNLFRRRCLIFD